MPLKIEAFTTKEGSSPNWILMTETSQYLTDRQLVPNVGEALTLVGKDGSKIDIEPASFKHIMTVKIKWLNYASSDVALLLHYVPF